jgi:hypothetical protein
VSNRKKSDLNRNDAKIAKELQRRRQSFLLRQLPQSSLKRCQTAVMNCGNLLLLLLLLRGCFFVCSSSNYGKQ